MATFEAVPVVDVHNENFKELWPTMNLALKSATFVALDLEMSGLGNRRLLLAKSIEDRYSTLCEVAKTRSVVSLGICCFKLQPNSVHVDPSQEVTHDRDGSPSKESKKNLHFFIQTFNIILLCKESYMVEPESLRFLVQHGFDFNKQYSKGISYYRGLDKPEENTLSIRMLFNEIVINKVPVALHNGLVDLVFLYHAFYSTVPSKLPQFVSDLSEIFAGGIYDTKYIIEYEVRMSSSYLEYVFRKSQKDNVQKYQTGSPHVQVSFPKYPASCDYIESRECGLPDSNRNYSGQVTCEQFAAFGWCKLADRCPNSHDIDVILNVEDTALLKKRQKRERQRENKRQRTMVLDAMEEDEKSSEDDDEMDSREDTSSGSGVNVQTERSISGANSDAVVTSVSGTISAENGIETKPSLDSDKIAKSRCTGHRAGFDAFMTGYTLAAAILKCGKIPETISAGAKLSDLKLDKLKNNVYLSGKDMPLKITKSNFSKGSNEHRLKYAKLMAGVGDNAMVT